MQMLDQGLRVTLDRGIWFGWSIHNACEYQMMLGIGYNRLRKSCAMMRSTVVREKRNMAYRCMAVGRKAETGGRYLDNMSCDRAFSTTNVKKWCCVPLHSTRC